MAALQQWQWPKCECGGVATSNGSGDITRTCIRCGEIIKPQYPSNEEMAKDLIASGWTQKRIGFWVAPNGAIYHGPFQAWKAKHGILLREGVFGDHRNV